MKIKYFFMKIGSKQHTKISFAYKIKLSLLTCISVSFCMCTNMLETNIEDQAIVLKQKGTHVFGRIDSINIQGYKETNIEWIALVPWGHQDDYLSAEVTHNRGDSLQIQKRNQRWKRSIDLAHEAGYKVFFKPHIWLSDTESGLWRSDIYPTSSENWKKWKSSYREFIIRYAKVAEEAQVELFCIGVEFTKLTLEFPEYWQSIIKDIRSVYSGKITYAANWYEEYENITFWDELDFIGIQAYFPLAEKNAPSVSEISKGWKKHLPKIEGVSKKYNKKILFTELGYKSTLDSAREPWKWIDYSDDSIENLCHETQANCYKAFFNSVWTKNWMAGLYIWQMRGDHKPENSINGMDFTPQSKPAEEIIKEGYSSQ